MAQQPVEFKVYRGFARVQEWEDDPDTANFYIPQAWAKQQGYDIRPGSKRLLVPAWVVESVDGQVHYCISLNHAEAKATAAEAYMLGT
jgi:hypothetical protein